MDPQNGPQPERPPGGLVAVPGPDGGVVVKLIDPVLHVATGTSPGAPPLRILQMDVLPGLRVELPMGEPLALRIAQALGKPVVERASAIPPGAPPAPGQPPK